MSLGPFRQGPLLGRASSSCAARPERDALPAHDLPVPPRRLHRRARVEGSPRVARSRRPGAPANLASHSAMPRSGRRSHPSAEAARKKPRRLQAAVSRAHGRGATTALSKCGDWEASSSRRLHLHARGCAIVRRRTKQARSSSQIRATALLEGVGLARAAENQSDVQETGESCWRR